MIPGALAAIAQRDLVKLWRDRVRLAVNLAFPVMLIVGLGSVLAPTVGRATGLDAVTLAFTGVLPASLFQSAAAGMVSIVEDRETDFARELFVAPLPRLVLLCGKLGGEGLVALGQGACIIAVGLAFGVHVAGAQLLRAALPCLACCLLGGAFGLATVAAAPNQRTAMQVFQFLIIPQYVLGGVLVPVGKLPTYLAVLSAAMPLRYLVELTRAGFYAGTRGYGQVVSMGVTADVAVASLGFIALLVAGAALFDHRERSR